MTIVIFALMLLVTFVFIGALGFAFSIRISALEREVAALKRGDSGTPVALTQPLPQAHTMGNDAEILDLMRRGQKIQAIKLYRERTGVGLKEAKDAVEALEIRSR